MLKTIKTIKYLNLHELIKYVWENNIVNETMTTSGGLSVSFWENGVFETKYPITSYDLFPVEVEEVITEDTEFDCIISVDKDGYTFKTFNTTIDYLNSTYSDLVQNLAYINGKFITIWERDNRGSN